MGLSVAIAVFSEIDGSPNLEAALFKIAEVARMTGVSPSTLRAWEAQGLVEPIRTDSGQRLYSQSIIDRLKRIVWLRNEQGLNPAAIRQQLELDDRSEAEAGLDSSDDVGAGGQAAIGWKLRSLRRDAGLTLEALAQMTGASTSQLSSFERTSQGLSLPVLHSVAQALGTTIARLSGERESTSVESLIRSGQWTTWPSSSSGVTIQPLAQGINQMECHRFVLAPGASSEGAYQHDGEEFLHVLDGGIELVLDGDRFFRLFAGDSFYFESRRPHSWRNVADSETVLIWINTPPTF